MNSMTNTPISDLETIYKIADIIFNLANEVPTLEQNEKIKEFAMRAMDIAKQYRI